MNLMKNPLKVRINKLSGIIITLIMVISIISINPVYAQDEKNVRTDKVYFTEEREDYGIDLNENELFDYLILEITIYTEEPGSYELGSELLTENDDSIMYVYKEFEAQEKYSNLKLRFDGEQIFSTKTSGHFICYLWIMNETDEVLDKTEYKTDYYYEYFDFEHTPPPAELSGRFSDFGTDENNDGLFEYLTISLDLDIIEDGHFTILAGLFKEIEDRDRKENVPEDEEFYYHLITAALVNVKLRTGVHDVELSFNGPKIYQSNFPGPYLVGIWLEEGELKDEKDRNTEPENEVLRDWYHERLIWPMVGEGDLSDDIVFETKEYTSKEFEKPPKIVKFIEVVKEYVIDLDDNGLIDFLVLMVELKVAEPGEYLVWGKIVTDDNWSSPWAENRTFVREGNHHVTLKFKGMEIHNSELIGQYHIIFGIKGKHPEGLPIEDRMKYRTKQKYSFKDFESDKIIEFDENLRPYAKLDLEGITTKTKIMEVYTTRTRPEITFWYADSDSKAEFKLIYSLIRGYKDLNGNNRFDFGEEKFIIDLMDNLWEIDNVDYSVNSKYGNYVEFCLSADISYDKIKWMRPIPMEENKLTKDLPPDTNSNTRQDKDTNIEEKKELELYRKQEYQNLWASIEMNFLVTSNTFQIEKPFTYEINGDTELKIDIDIKFHKSLDIDGLSLEQVLFNEAKDYGFKTKEASGDNIYLPENNVNNEKKTVRPVDEKNLHQFEIKPDNQKQWIMFIDDSGKEYGFYSWVPKINMTYLNGKSEIIKINTSYLTDGTELRLFTNYPYTKKISSINHDPSIGMVRENKPPRSYKSKNGLEEILFNPMVYLVACMIAVIFLILLRGNQMKGKRGLERTEISKKPPQREPRRPKHKPSIGPWIKSRDHNW